jgi:UDP-N-acetylmuramyl pentapeptide phosphotransferase/UDP-N-acetylglucosamine-1-phosphate transferase
MTGSTLTLAAVPAATLAISYGITGLVVGWLRHRAILDHPNDRSSHTIPTPRGGGWGIMLTLLPAWAALGWATGRMGFLIPVLAAMALLMAISWIDDRHNLSPVVRLPAQVGAVVLGLTTLPDDALIFQGLLPWVADRAVATLCWVWFINLFNFMDGIDGLAGTEAATVGSGIAVVALLAGLGPEPAWLGLALAGAALGFLGWNWHPARVFMGDVGSIPLGFALGWLLILLAASGHLAAALLLPLYFVTDATLTLLRRLSDGKRVWQAHREHFYQRAVQSGYRHSAVVRRVLATNLILVGLAALSVAVEWPALAAGIAAVGVLLAALRRPPL